MNENMESEVIELTDEDLIGISGGKGTEKHSFSCPGCGGDISISMQQILASDAVFCPRCGLRISIVKTSDILDKLLEISKQ